MIISIIYVVILFVLIGIKKIGSVLKMLFSIKYWTDYNIIEFSAWMAKAAIIIPGLVYGKEIWQLHFLTLFTSSLLIWASMRKSLPTLILFNTIWIFISLSIIIRHISF
jgi:hypothetical protein